MKRLISVVLILSMLLSPAFAAPVPPEIQSPSAVLMEKSTGTVIYQKDAHSKRPPASVTKIMTLLLVMEAIDSGKISMDDTVTVSPHAASMGGSQVYLEPGEQMSMDDMLKATIIASGNDAATALAEHVCGSTESFVSLMNQRAQELSMKDTTFKNCTGLDEEGHVTSAYDIAIMSGELIKYDLIKKYTTIWMDSLRNGEFQLANTNKLIRSYKGITGLKTGFTSNAMYCYSGTAERDGMELIVSVMAAPSSQQRFSDASSLLNFGFANYSLYDIAKDISTSPVPVIFGKSKELIPQIKGSQKLLVEKNDYAKIKKEVRLPESIKAPVEVGQKIGEVIIFNDTKQITSIPMISGETVNKLGFSDIFWRMFSKFAIR